MSDVDLDRLFQMAVERISDRQLKADVLAVSEQVRAAPLPTEATEHEPGEGEKPADDKSQALANKIREMDIPQRIKLAMFGNHTARTILLRDPNRLIPFFVLENPRITDNEILEIAKNTQVDENLLRIVGNNLQWMKGYPTKMALVANPKAPVDVTLRWLKFIKDKDLTRLSKSKGVPQVVASQARKLVEKRSQDK